MPNCDKPDPVVSFSTFLMIWKKYFTYLYIRPPGRDICLSCHIFRNKEKYLVRTTGSEDEVSLDNDESLIIDASRHVLDAKSQHELANAKKQLAKLDAYKGKMEPKIVTITIDYFQNLDLPHLGNEQPGDCYYYSPMNLYYFGIADSTQEHLHE